MTKKPVKTPAGWRKTQDGFTRSFRDRAGRLIRQLITYDGEWWRLYISVDKNPYIPDGVPTLTLENSIEQADETRKQLLDTKNPGAAWHEAKGWRKTQDGFTRSFRDRAGRLIRQLITYDGEWWRLYISVDKNPYIPDGVPTLTLENSIEQADETRKQLLDTKNPGAAWHEAKEREARRMDEAATKQWQKDFYHGKAVAHMESAIASRAMGENQPVTAYGVIRTPAAKRAALRRERHNPLVIYGLGNPGARVQARVEGVIYNRVLEIRAEKTGYKPGLYRHPFTKSAKVCLLALDTGDILVHSRAGKKLWKIDR